MIAALQRIARLLGFELLTADQARELRSALVALEDGFYDYEMRDAYDIDHLYDDEAVSWANKTLSNVLRWGLPDGEAELQRTREWMYPHPSGGKYLEADDDLPF